MLTGESLPVEKSPGAAVTGGALDTEVTEFFGGDPHGAAQGFGGELVPFAQTDEQDALRREFARRVKEEDLALGSPKLFGTDVTEQVLEGGGPVKALLLEGEQNGGRLLLREGGGSGDRKIHMFVPWLDYSNARASVNARRAVVARLW